MCECVGGDRFESYTCQKKKNDKRTYNVDEGIFLSSPIKRLYL